MTSRSKKKVSEVLTPARSTVSPRVKVLPPDIQMVADMINRIRNPEHIQLIRSMLIERSRDIARMNAMRKHNAQSCPQRRGNLPHLWRVQQLDPNDPNSATVRACNLCRYVEFSLGQDIDEQSQTDC
jgi:hypothetical protein